MKSLQNKAELQRVVLNSIYLMKQKRLKKKVNKPNDHCRAYAPKT